MGLGEWFEIRDGRATCRHTRGKHRVLRRQLLNVRFHEPREVVELVGIKVDFVQAWPQDGCLEEERLAVLTTVLQRLKLVVLKYYKTCPSL